MSLNAEVAAAAHLTEEQLAGFIIEGTKDVFSTMIMMEVADAYPLAEPLGMFHCGVTGMVGLAGSYSGILSIHCPPEFAMLATSNMLGMEVTEIGEDVTDALGEIANMMGGNIKMALSKGGADLHLSVPTVISGEEYTVVALSDKECVIVPFTGDGHRFIVGLKLKKES
ncbi:MAG: chemotaxis protein CheX [Desulfuromonadales bacterium]|nr:MAG: chemotaxis protein CheX [Desulfuromonadales bacterium]